MEDEKIIALYWQRDQSAIDETDRKYGVQLRGLSYGILSDREDAEECVSDTYMAVWNSLPPQRPKRLRAYAAAIVRNLSLRRVRDRYSKKRGGGEVALVLEELEDCLCSQTSVEREYEQKELAGWEDRGVPAHTIRRRPAYLHVPLLGFCFCSGDRT